jgi:2-amino-4-hydroxy-6-hydroxymethyldihydropteridine diphosphokinase
MAKVTIAYIGLGSNLGNRKDFFGKALMMLKEIQEVSLTRTSTQIETKPLGDANHPKFLNAVAEVTTTLNADQLHKKLIQIEVSLGRESRPKWSPRTIDLDILLFGDQIINTPELTIPHAQMHLRSFVLSGMCELCFPFVHPVLNETMEELKSRLNGADFVLNPDLPQLVSVAGIIGVGKTTLTEKLSKSLSCKALFEAYDTNPFMPDVYAGKKELALDSQLYFLTSRIEQLNHDSLAKGQLVISDYVFDKELIYARRLLDAQQLALYEKVYPPVGPKIAVPVLVIYLQDSVQKCLEHIHSRNRPYEQEIAPQFLETLHCDYEQLFADWKTCPVIRKQMSELDCTKDADIDHLADQIKSYAAA